MFTNIFTRSKTSSTSQNAPKKSTNTIFKFIKRIFEKKNVFFIKTNIKDKDIIKIQRKVLANQNKAELNRRLHLFKEELLATLTFNTTLFRIEWLELYRYSPSFQQLWLLYTQRPRYYFTLFFNLRQTRLYRLFNVDAKNAGVYEHKSNYNYSNIYWGFISFWNALKIWIFSLTFFVTAFYVLLVKRTCVLPQTLFFWVGVSMLLYWLLSGFVFFVKKYQFSRYTSVIQRFWRRSYILFWLIESCLLLVFFYLMVNSSQESFYMFDQGYFLKTHLFSWKLFLFKCIIVVSLITYSYLFLLNLKWTTFNKNILGLALLTVLLLYLVWTEFYQIYWVSNFYANFAWLYDVEEAVWSLEFDNRRTRMVNHYIMVLFILKFWHIIFIFGCWVFFLLRSNELETITYPLYSFNFQNFIILFLMMWLFMFPWFRHTYNWIGEIPYYWFYVDTHISFYKVLVTDIYMFYSSVLSYIITWTTNYTYNITDFINWSLFDTNIDPNVFIKSTIKNEILKSLI